MGKDAAAVLRIVAVICLLVVIVVMTVLLMKPLKEHFLDLYPMCNSIPLNKVVCEGPPNLKLDKGQENVLKSMYTAYQVFDDDPNRCKPLDGCIYKKDQYIKECSQVLDKNLMEKVFEDTNEDVVNGKGSCYMSWTADESSRKKFTRGLSALHGYKEAHQPEKIIINEEERRQKVHKESVKNVTSTIETTTSQLTKADEEKNQTKQQTQVLENNVKELSGGVQYYNKLVGIETTAFNDLDKAYKNTKKVFLDRESFVQADQGTMRFVRHQSNGAVIIQKQINVPNYVNGYFTLAYKYCVLKADPYDLWVNAGNQSFVNHETDYYDNETTYRNETVMKLFFGDPNTSANEKSGYVYIEIFNHEKHKLIGWMLFKKPPHRVGTVELTSWFSQKNYLTGSIELPDRTPNYFSIEGDPRWKRRWMINYAYNGCHRDPMGMVIPYGWVCPWDSYNRGWILMPSSMEKDGSSKIQNVGGYDEENVKGFKHETNPKTNWNEVSNDMRGDIMYVYVLQADHDFLSDNEVIKMKYDA
jgi:hypothetical protein